MSDKDDCLLYIVSAWQEISWQTFRKAFDNLSMRDSAFEAETVEAVHYRRQAHFTDLGLARTLRCGI